MSNTLSVESFKEILYQSAKEKVKNALNPVFQAIGEMTKGTTDEAEMRLSLLDMVQRATGELVEEMKGRVQQKAKK